MTRFAKMFSVAGVPHLLRQFGEQITYHYSVGGVSQVRVIDAKVERNVNAIVSEVPGQAVPQAIVTVANSCTTGIGSHEIDTAVDELSFPLRIGEDPTRRPIGRIISDANGRLVLAVM